MALFGQLVLFLLSSGLRLQQKIYDIRSISIFWVVYYSCIGNSCWQLGRICQWKI